MKKLLAIILASAMVLSLAACGGSAAPAAEAAAETEAAAPVETEAVKAEEVLEPAEQASKSYKIGFSVKTLVNEPFQSFIADTIKKRVEEHGGEFVLMTTTDQTAIAEQVSQVEDLIAQGCDAIVLNPIDSSAVIPVMKEMKELGIPCVLVDTPPAADCPTDCYLTYVGTDNEAASKVAGQHLAETLGGEGKVAIIRGTNGNVCAEQRASGFKAGLEGTNIEVVAEQPGDFTADKAMQAMENILTTNPDLDAVWVSSDGMCIGVITAIQNNAQANQDMLIYSFDGSKDGIEMVRDGDIVLTMAQYPRIMGENAVDFLYQVLEGEKTEADFAKFTDSGTNCVTQDKVEEALPDGF